MNPLLRKLERSNKIEEARREDPEHFPKEPEFVEFCGIDDNFSRYLFCYLKKDYEKTSQEFKDVCKNYSNIAWNFDLTPYNVSGGKSSDSFVGMVSAFPFRIGSISASGIGVSGAKLRKLIKAEKRLLKFEKKEGIKRISESEKRMMIDEYNRKVDVYIEKREENKSSKLNIEEELTK